MRGIATGIVVNQKSYPIRDILVRSLRRRSDDRDKDGSISIDRGSIDSTPWWADILLVVNGFKFFRGETCGLSTLDPFTPVIHYRGIRGVAGWTIALRASPSSPRIPSSRSLDGRIKADDDDNDGDRGKRD